MCSSLQSQRHPRCWFSCPVSLTLLQVSILHTGGNDGSYYGRLWLLLLSLPLFRDQSRFPRTLGIWTHRVQRLIRKFWVIFESNRVPSSYAGLDSVVSVSLVVSLSNGTISNLLLSCALRIIQIINMYSSEINGSIFRKGHTQNAQESESVLRERMLFLLTTTACPREKSRSQCCW